MPDKASELATALESTEEAVRELSEKVSVSEAQARRARFASKLALVGIALDMILTVVVGYGLFGVTTSQDRISDLQAELRIETDRNQKAQCAMIALFLQFEPRTTTNPSYSDEQRAQQVEAYKTLHQIDHDLGCAGQ